MNRLKEIDWRKILSITVWVIIGLTILFNITHKISCKQYFGDEKEKCKAYYQDEDYRATSQDLQP